MFKRDNLTRKEVILLSGIFYYSNMELTVNGKDGMKLITVTNAFLDGALLLKGLLIQHTFINVKYHYIKRDIPLNDLCKSSGVIIVEGLKLQGKMF